MSTKDDIALVDLKFSLEWVILLLDKLVLPEWVLATLFRWVIILAVLLLDWVIIIICIRSFPDGQFGIMSKHNNLENNISGLPGDLGLIGHILLLLWLFLLLYFWIFVINGEVLIFLNF